MCILIVILIVAVVLAAMLAIACCSLGKVLTDAMEENDENVACLV